jgi:hypothetical protein
MGVSSLGAVSKETMKRLASVLKLSTISLARLGQKISDAAIQNSMDSWRSHQTQLNEDLEILVDG